METPFSRREGKRLASRIRGPAASAKNSSFAELFKEKLPSITFAVDAFNILNRTNYVT